MALCEGVVDPNTLLLPVVLLLLYLGSIVVSIVNTAYCFQRKKDVLPSALIAAHLAFCVLGTVAFFCISSVLWLWSAKYAYTHAERMWRLCVGLWAMCFLKDLPLTVIETEAYQQVGWQQGNFMDAAFIVQIVFFVPSALATSATISWYASGFLERQFGDAMAVSMQEKDEGPRRVPPELAAQLAAAVPLQPPLPLREMQCSPTHPPRRSPVRGIYAGQSGGSGGEVSHEPLMAPAVNNNVVAEYNDAFVLQGGGVHVRFALDDDVRSDGGEEKGGPYPAVI